jgi:hypothetical protein
VKPTQPRTAPVAPYRRPQRKDRSALPRSATCRGRSWSSASSAIASSGTARLLGRVLVCLTRPFACARRIWMTPAARSTSPCLSANMLRRAKSGRGREHDHRSERRREPLGQRPDLRPGIERPLLPAPPSGIGHPAPGRVVVDQLPGDRPAQYLPERLGRLEAMPSGTISRHAHTCSGESSARRTPPSSGVAFPSSQRSFVIVTRSP